MNYIKEIKKVGFKNWFWFKFIIKGNEFHKSLNMNVDKFNNIEYVDKIYRKRRLAHKIEMELNDNVSNNK